MTAATDKLPITAWEFTRKFLQLPYVTKIDVAEKCGLLNSEESIAPDQERWIAIFKRAKQEGKLCAMWEEIQKHNPTQPQRAEGK